jgi:ATP-dependent Lon protease
MLEATTNQQNLQLPLLLTDGFFLFPKFNCSLPLNGENARLKHVLIQAWKEHKGQLLIVSSKEKITDPNVLQNLDNFYLTGTWGKIVLDLTHETDAESVINFLQEIRLEGLERVQIINPVKVNDFWKSEYRVLSETERNKDEKITSNALIKKFVRHLPSILKRISLDLTEKLPDLVMGDLGNFIDFLAQINPEIPRQIKQAILSSVDLSQRLDYLLGLPAERNEQKSVDKEINSRVNDEAKKEEEVYRLRKAQKIINEKLQKLEGSDTSSWEQKYLQRLEKEPFPQEVKDVVREQIGQLKLMPPHFGEAHIVRNYVDLLMALPWLPTQITSENQDIKKAKQILEKEHFGLKESKKTILKLLSTIQHTGETLGEILCFVGPPGVGKTSLAKSIAKAMGRKFIRISLGGIRDVALITGFRRTYIGSMPGRIIQEFKKVKVKNPVILLDEIDKVNKFSGYQGDPSSTLLEVLDPEQNKNFVDHYLEVPFDLSKSLFICTANNLSNILRPLRDRMWIIPLSSYTPLEKLTIALNYLIPKNLAKYKLEKFQISFLKKTIEFIIDGYARESGVRKLERLIKEILQSFILDIKTKKDNSETKIRKISPKLIESEDYLGKPIYEFTQKEENPQPGVVNGLAWTEFGGDILPIEVNYYSGKGELGKLTGSLGDVMKESVTVAFNYIRSYLEEIKGQNSTEKEKIESYLETFNKSNFNLHAPEGAVPKDGPSAGITIATAILSALTKRVIPADIGMTGEITLTGNVLAIGGLKEKAIAAHRGKLKTIFIPKKNEKDIKDIPAEIRKELKIILVNKYWEVWESIFPSKIVPRASVTEIATTAA